MEVFWVAPSGKAIFSYQVILIHGQAKLGFNRRSLPELINQQRSLSNVV
ncbi:MAG: hypothetical protein RLZZ04_4428 [Cyanobacteriota bacterium]|jgi:hypothetical protein